MSGHADAPTFTREQIAAALVSVRKLVCMLGNDMRREMLTALYHATRPMIAADLVRDAPERLKRNAGSTATILANEGFAVIGRSSEVRRSKVYTITHELRSRLLPMVQAVKTLLFDDDQEASLNVKVPALGRRHASAIQALTDAESMPFTLELWATGQPRPQAWLTEQSRIRKEARVILERLVTFGFAEHHDSDEYVMTHKTRSGIRLAVEASTLPASTMELEPEAPPMTLRAKPGLPKKGSVRHPTSIPDNVQYEPDDDYDDSRHCMAGLSQAPLMKRTAHLDRPTAKPYKPPVEQAPVQPSGRPIIVLRNGRHVQIGVIPDKPTSSSAADPE